MANCKDDFIKETNGKTILCAEYDGSEWWEYKSCPQVPDELKGA